MMILYSLAIDVANQVTSGRRLKILPELLLSGATCKVSLPRLGNHFTVARMVRYHAIRLAMFALWKAKKV
jgi:hypothetical protein